MSNSESLRPEHQALIEMLTDPQSITQSMLEYYEQLRNSESTRQTLRRTILHLLDINAPVEPGEWTVRATPVEYRNFSGPKLAAVLGEEHVAELLELIEPTIARHLEVRHLSGRRRADGSLMTIAEYMVAQEEDAIR